MTAPGVHISFFELGEAAGLELPAIGPLHGVLVRGARLVIEHADVAVPDEPGIAVTRWLAGVVEMQRATGETPAGRRRKSMRVSAPDGLYVRFGAVGEPAASLREVGPFVLVLVGPRTIEAGGEVLATRPSGEGGMWTLTANADPSAVGAQRPDVGFRSASTPYHPWLSAGQAATAHTTPAPATPAAAPTAGPAATPNVVTPAPVPSQRVLKDSDLDLLERRARLQKEIEVRADERDQKVDAALSAADARAATNARYAAAVREEAQMREAALREAAAREDASREAAALDKKGKRGRGGGKAQATTQAKTQAKPQAATRPKAPARESVASRRIRQALESTGTEESSADGTNWLELMWRLRFAMLALLVLGAGVYVFAAAQPRSATGQPQEHTYGLGQKISGVRWDYVVNGIQREPIAGTVRARGIYLAVRVTLTNKGGASAQASPNDFALVDGAGTRYSPESLQSGVYSSPDNRSPFEWPTTYPPGRAVTTRVVFDVETTLSGLQLVINDLPGTKVKIE